ncbi:MAG: hypothetical protein JSV82_07370 [Planctomycetota bacterium]|nr:MAG: hypothetical protein JSV82_07370 [Planctomycetota bacterium]
MKAKKSRVSDKSLRQKSLGSTYEAELALKQDQFKLTRLDYFLAPLVATLACVWAFPYVGTAVNWDDLLYMNLSQYTTPYPFYLNRYGHVYLQKFFFWLTRDAITGGRVYWCFLFFATCVLVYWCAKIIAGRKNYLTGLVAVLLFCMQPILMRHLGCPLADFTIAFLVMLGTFVYLTFIARKQKGRHLAIMILGLIFFWTVKSKEIGLWMGVLFLGLGENEQGARSLHRFIKDIGWVCVGMITGFVLLMTLDLFFMGDAWFSMRPSSIRDLFRFNIASLGHPQKNLSWYIILSSGPILPVFLLYLLKGHNLSKGELMPWLIPLLMVSFLTAVTIRVNWDFPVRFLIPAMAGMSVWAAQFFRLEVAAPKKLSWLPKSLIGSISILFAFLITLFIMHRLEALIEADGWLKVHEWKSLDALYNCVILPLSTSFLLIYVIALKKRGPLALFFLSLCLFFIIYFPLKNNMTLLKQRVVAKKGEWRFTPYRVFKDELRFDKDKKILVSKDVHARSWMLGRNQNSHCWMFNIFFNQKFDYVQFIDGSREDILKGNYTYAFLTWGDWNAIQEKHNVEHLTKNYDIKSHKETQLILLKKR